MLEPDSILVRLPFRLGPSDVSNSLAQESNHERILALDLESVGGEKLRHPVRHDLLELLSGHRLEAAQKLRPSESSMAGALVCYISYAENNLQSLRTAVEM